MKKKDRFTEDHKRYYPLIFNTVYSKVENIDDTSDICQEIFTRFFEKYEEIENSRKWLYGALRLVVMEYYRKQRSNLNLDEVFRDVGLTFVNGFKEARVIIAEAIENMENFKIEENRVLFDLVALHNYSYSQAGKELGLTKRTVEYRYRQIVDTILDYLKKKGIRNIEDLL